MYCVKGLGLDIEKVNVNGGAIALGHPLDKYSGIQDRSSALIRCGLFTVYRCPSACDRVQRVASTTGQGGHVCNNNLDRCSKTDVFHSHATDSGDINVYWYWDGCCRGVCARDVNSLGCLLGLYLAFCILNGVCSMSCLLLEEKKAGSRNRLKGQCRHEPSQE